MAHFDWHSDPITRAAPIMGTYRNTQNVRRFFRAQRGDHFKFARPFMAWLIDGVPQTMGDAADEWLRSEKCVTASHERRRTSKMQLSIVSLSAA